MVAAAILNGMAWAPPKQPPDYPDVRPEDNLGPTFEISTGEQVPTPPVASLDCQQMKSVLDTIFKSGYRGRNPRPSNEADMPLRRYEDRVAQAYYRQCNTKPTVYGSVQQQ